MMRLISFLCRRDSPPLLVEEKTRKENGACTTNADKFWSGFLKPMHGSTLNYQHGNGENGVAARGEE
jgi:hypothetical protein